MKENSNTKELNEDFINEKLSIFIDGVEYQIVESLGYEMNPQEVLEYGFFIDYDEYDDENFNIFFKGE